MAEWTFVRLIALIVSLVTWMVTNNFFAKIIKPVGFWKWSLALSLGTLSWVAIQLMAFCVIWLIYDLWI